MLSRVGTFVAFCLVPDTKLLVPGLSPSPTFPQASKTHKSGWKGHCSMFAVLSSVAYFQVPDIFCLDYCNGLQRTSSATRAPLKSISCLLTKEICVKTMRAPPTLLRDSTIQSRDHVLGAHRRQEETGMSPRTLCRQWGAVGIMVDQSIAV